jgi:hypothetical protein
VGPSTRFASIEPGQIITFHPPTEATTTYSHRVVARNSDGTITTKGDINGAPDAWHLTKSDVVGRVQARWWGIGWLVKALPILLIGGAVLWLLTRFFTTPRWRLPARIMGVAGLVTLAVYVVKPLARATLISFVPLDNGARATYVATGLLPMRLSAPHDGHVDLWPGHVGSIVSTHANANGRFSVQVTPTFRRRGS